MYIFRVVAGGEVFAVDADQAVVIDESLVFKDEGGNVVRSFAPGDWRECVELAELPRRENVRAASVPVQKKPWIEHSSIEEWRRATAGW